MSQIDIAIKALQKNFGKSIITNFTDNPVIDRERVSTGSRNIDAILGGGLLRGVTIELFGKESSGKTTVALHMMATHQKVGKVLFIDTEHSFDPRYAEKLGVNLDTLLLSQPDYAEQAIEVIEAMAATGEVSLIVLDSVAAMAPRVEYEGKTGESYMGVKARLMGQHLRKVTAPAYKNKCSIVYINQIREKIGIVFGNPETTPGGNALKFHASIRLDCRKIAANKDKDGNFESITTRVRSVKNKTCAPFQDAEIKIQFGQGILPIPETIDLAILKGVIIKGGAWYNYKEEKWQGLANLTLALIEDSNLYKEICDQLGGEPKDVIDEPKWENSGELPEELPREDSASEL